MLEHTAARDALAHLGVAPGPPDLALLDALVAAYVCTVPWESASRIVRRARAADPASAALAPEAFWAETIARGTGGTCFESNGAFFALLQALGFDAHLTVNDMGATARCHTAIVARVGGGAWLVDVGLPLYVPVPLAPDTVSERAAPLMTYRTVPDGQGRYQVERSPHPKANAFTLLPAPVAPADYRAATAADYGPGGLFLDQVIVTKVVAGRIARFAGRDAPARIETFAGGERADIALGGDVPAEVAAYFGMDEGVVRAALGLSSSA